jgi:hypothetical protein
VLETLSCVCVWCVARRHLHLGSTSSRHNGPGAATTRIRIRIPSWKHGWKPAREDEESPDRAVSHAVSRHATPLASPQTAGARTRSKCFLSHTTHRGLFTRPTGDRYRYTRGALRYTVSMFWHPLPNVCSRVSRLASRCGLGYPPSVSRASRHRDGRRRAR